MNKTKIFAEVPALVETRKKMPLLSQQRQWAAEYQSFNKLKIYHNTPLALNTLLAIEVLVAGGAEVTVGVMKAVSPNLDVINILRQHSFRIVDTPASDEKYDIHIDCCAELISHKPNIGSIELTQSGDQVYQNSQLEYPVISINQCSVKRLETIATGVAFIEAFYQLTGVKLDHKKVIIFGCGKVGQGIISALRACQAEIVVIDQDQEIISYLKEKGFVAFHIDDIDAIKFALKQACCAVTATGKVDIFKQSKLTLADFADVHLANMGAHDEFGSKFPTERVLFKKKPINFSLPSPTPDNYIDPIFYAQNKAVILLTTHQYVLGFHAFPTQDAMDILSTWQKFNKYELGFTTNGRLFSFDSTN